MPAEIDQRLLLERDAPQTLVARALAAARDGQGQALAVVGPAGLGKTTLLRASREAAQGFQVLAARPGELERHVPFGVVHQLLDRVVLEAGPEPRRELFSGAAALTSALFEPEHLVERFATSSGLHDPAAGDGAVELYPSLHGLYWLLANLSRLRPVLLVIDDAQWADRPSLAFVELLARRCEGLPVMVLVGTRPPEDQAHPELLQMLADPVVQRIVLHPLSSGAVQALISERLGARPHGTFVDACVAETGGNPFLLTELLREVEAQRLTPNADTAHTVGALAPDGVSAAIAVRLSRMSSDAAAVAEAVAVLGDGVALPLVAAQATKAEPEVRAAVRSLVQAGLLVLNGGSVSFVHPLMRTTVLARTDPLDRDAAHRRAAELLSDHGHDDATVAAHLHQTSPTGSPRAVAALRRAARSARSIGEPQVAALHLRRALEEPPSEDLADVLVELGQAESAAGMLAADEHLRRAVEISEGPTRAAAVLSLARSLKFRGGAVEAVHLLRDELTGLPPEMQVHAQAEVAAARTSSAGARRLLGTQPIELDQPWATTDELRLMVGALRSFDIASSGGSRQEALTLAVQALRVRPLPMDPLTSAGIATLSAGVACYWLGELAHAESAFAAMLTAARDAGSPVATSTASGMLALLAWRRGDVAGCASHAQEALDLSDEVATAPPLVAAALGAGALAAAEQVLDADELRGWERRLAAAELDADATPKSEVVHSRGVLQLALGDLDRAAGFFLQAGEGFLEWGATSPAVKTWRSDAALVLNRLGRADQSRELVAEEIRLAEACGAPSPLAVALTARAVVQPENAEDDLNQAAALLDGAGTGRLDLVRNRLELGRLLRRQGRLVEARNVLQEAMEQAVRCGAERTAAAARDELVAAGARPRRVAVTGHESLTGAERRVAELAVTGRSNREIAQELFVSEKTVETHLGHTYAKLGIRSRTALAQALGPEPT